MGTTYNVKVAKAPNTLDTEALASQITSILQTVDAQMSTYRADSELSLVNAAAAGEWVPVSAETAMVVGSALKAAELTGGAFDPTIGPLVDLWGFGPKGARSSRSVRFGDRRGARVCGSPPRRAERRGHWQNSVRDAARPLRHRQGFGVDQIAALLESQGLRNYLVEVGGELRAKGRPADDRAWRVGVEKPTLAGGQFQRVLELDGDAMATSGNYRSFSKPTASATPTSSTRAAANR